MTHRGHYTSALTGRVLSVTSQLTFVHKISLAPLQTSYIITAQHSVTWSECDLHLKQIKLRKTTRAQKFEPDARGDKKTKINSSPSVTITISRYGASGSTSSPAWESGCWLLDKDERDGSVIFFKRIGGLFSATHSHKHSSPSAWSSECVCRWTEEVRLCGQHWEYTRHPLLTSVIWGPHGSSVPSPAAESQWDGERCDNISFSAWLDRQLKVTCLKVRNSTGLFTVSDMG